ncbi:unnamed protein product, partial [Polarella glacialis]
MTAAAKDVGNQDVIEATDFFADGMGLLRELLAATGVCAKPQDTAWQKILGAVMELGTKAQKACDNRSECFQNRKSAAEALNVITLVTSLSPPAHVQNVLESMDFYATKVMQKKNEKETVWIKALKTAVKDLKDWCGENCKLGVMWNPRGKVAADYFAENPLGSGGKASAASEPKGKGKGKGPAMPKGGLAAPPPELLAKMKPEDAKSTSGGNGGYYVGGECGQGFFYTLFYKSGPPARRALEGAGVWDNGVFESAQIDRCIWNYQTSYQCRADLDCTKVRVHHKPTRERGSDPHECEKLKIRERRKELARRKKLDRKPPTPEELAAAQEGQLLKHSGGLCVRPADETFTQDDSNLVLMDCHEPPTEQNIRLVAVEGGDEDEEGSVVLLKQGGSCGHMESDEDPEMMPREPKILFPMDCDSTKHVMTFKKLEHKTLAGAFLLKHSSGCRA